MLKIKNIKEYRLIIQKREIGRNFVFGYARN